MELMTLPGFTGRESLNLRRRTHHSSDVYHGFLHGQTITLAQQQSEGGGTSEEGKCWKNYVKALGEIDDFEEECYAAQGHDIWGLLGNLGCSAISRGREIAAGTGYWKCVVS